jgi:phage-related protein
METLSRPLRPLLWVASSKRDYATFPAPVQDAFGFALFLAQQGQHPPIAKLMKGFGGVVELIGNHRGDTYRAVYTVRLAAALYVLHAFKKKSKRGVATPQTDIAVIRRRLKDAEADHARRFETGDKG